MNALLQKMVIQRQYRGVTPPARITAPHRDLRVVTAADFDNRDRYMRQSEATVAGKRAELPA